LSQGPDPADVYCPHCGSLFILPPIRGYGAARGVVAGIDGWILGVTAVLAIVAYGLTF
jgi:hypothetical protein